MCALLISKGLGALARGMLRVTNFGDLPSDVLGNLVNFNISIPKLPAGVTIKNISITQQGLKITAAGTNTTLSQ